MKMDDSALHRLLRSAAQANDQEPISVPFGFDTRVVALARSAPDAGGNGIARLIRRVAMIATAVILISSAAAFRELLATRDIAEPGANDYAIADSEIQQEFYQ